MKKIVLASTSFRRIELLKRLGVEFDSIEPRVANEVFYNNPFSTVIENSRLKAFSVKELVSRDSIVIAADTIVVSPNGELLGKPSSSREVYSMLKKLSGKWHRVLTGVTILDVESGFSESFVVETRVKFKELSDRELRLYSESMEGVGKAGGYAIQGIASLLIERVDGDYYNVMGLPLNELYKRLLKYGVDILEQACTRALRRQ